MRWRFWRKPASHAVESDEKSVTVITKVQLQRMPKTTRVLVAPSLIASCMEKAATHPENEVGGFILGRADGGYLVLEEIVHLAHVGERSRVPYSPKDLFDARRKANQGQAIVGWFHSHPGYGVFLSAIDLRHHEQCQALFPDFVGLVMDPLRPCGVDFAFLRNEDGAETRVPYQYLTGEVGE